MYLFVIVGINSKTNVKNFVWMNTQSFVVLGKGMAFCVNKGGIDLQKYFFDKLYFHSVTAQT